MQAKQFSQTLLTWYQQYGRHDLPWQKKTTPYRVWVSEIMLQQTQVSTVIPYYQKFIKRFPNNKSLALANLDDVLAHWSGLGYYARARNLHRTALIIHEQYYGRFPKSLSALTTLPGIGRSTAGAILSLAMNISATILDGNVKRVLARYYAISGWPGNAATAKELWQLAENLTPNHNVHQYNQAMMDLGAMICTRSKPRCELCPLQTQCQAHVLQQTTNFPAAKPKRERPLKKINMLIMYNERNELLLEKRPPTGIWGGLWSFPESVVSENLHQFCQQHYQQKILNIKKLKSFLHQFSHFQLEIHPLLLSVRTHPSTVMETPQRIWYKLTSMEKPGGMATPVNQILNQLSEKVLTT